MSTLQLLHGDANGELLDPGAIELDQEHSPWKWEHVGFPEPKPVYLITGGTGFIGRALVKYVLEHNLASKVISFSRRWDDAEALAREVDDDRFRAINGSVENYDELRSAFSGVDYVIHAAAYKSVPSAEYNPFVAKSVNVDGSENVIKAAINAGVVRVLCVSTDKACSAINLYGRTKAVMESMAISANNLGRTRFSVARYGNVIGSTGSVIPFFKAKAEAEEPLPITNGHMTRFWFDKDDAVQFVMDCLDRMHGGEVFVPKLKSASINRLFVAFEQKYWAKRVDVGERPGEKLHEAMISPEEAREALDLEWAFMIPPPQHDWDASWYDLYEDAKEFTTPEGKEMGFTSEIAERLALTELMEII